MKARIRNWLPTGDAMFRMIVVYLPSPINAANGAKRMTYGNRPAVCGLKVPLEKVINEGARVEAEITNIMKLQDMTDSCNSSHLEGVSHPHGCGAGTVSAA